MVRVDTPVWSLSLRRRAVDLSPQEREITRSLYELIGRNEAQILGLTRQEVLSGIREDSQFQRIRDHLRDFKNVELESADYEDAAEFRNKCRRYGIAGSTVDVLLCATSLRREWEIFTTDHDFVHYSRIAPLRLFHLSMSGPA
jgi:predicted nucleic acid-binding protein